MSSSGLSSSSLRHTHAATEWAIRAGPALPLLLPSTRFLPPFLSLGVPPKSGPGGPGERAPERAAAGVAAETHGLRRLCRVGAPPPPPRRPRRLDARSRAPPTRRRMLAPRSAPRLCRRVPLHVAAAAAKSAQWARAGRRASHSIPPTAPRPAPPLAPPQPPPPPARLPARVPWACRAPAALRATSIGPMAGAPEAGGSGGGRRGRLRCGRSRRS
jgi:hypothetical protein